MQVPEALAPPCRCHTGDIWRAEGENQAERMGHAQVRATMDVSA